MKLKNVFINIAVALSAIVGFFLFTSKKKAAVKEIDAEVKETEEKIAEVKEEQKKVAKRRRNKKRKVAQVKAEVAELETAKETLKVEERPAEEVKENIINKSRRGRKPNKA